MSILDTLQAQPQRLVLSEALLLLVLIGWFDYTTGWEWNLFVFYAVPITLVTWRADHRYGAAFAVLCAVVWWLAHAWTHPYETTAGFVLTIASHLVYFAIVVAAVTAMKRQQTLAQSHFERRERARALERDVLWAREREEQRLGSHLHDSLGSELAAIAYATTFLLNDLRERKQPEAEAAGKLLDMVNGAATTVRNMSRGLFQVEPDESGLEIALAQLALTASAASRMSVSFCETGEVPCKNLRVAMHLYRIAQEAVNNAVKHSGASKVTIFLDRRDDALYLAIADNGKGIPSSPGGERGIGLRTMRYRARAVGGDLITESLPNEGTFISCNIPNQFPATGVATV